MWKEHHLSKEHDKISCPLNRKYICNGHCAWFDHEHQDCRQLGGHWLIVESLIEIRDVLYILIEEIKSDK